jgi:hypothetical protein
MDPGGNEHGVIQNMDRPPALHEPGLSAEQDRQDGHEEEDELELSKENVNRLVVGNKIFR